MKRAVALAFFAVFLSGQGCAAWRVTLFHGWTPESASLRSLGLAGAWERPFGKGPFYFSLEVFTQLYVEPQRAGEFGFTPLFRISAPVPMRPYFEAGSGLLWTNLEVPELGTRFNFSSQVGAGFEIFPYRFGYRFRHVSNAGISERNLGLEGHFFLFSILL